jgi:hypothetical protein
VPHISCWGLNSTARDRQASKIGGGSRMGKRDKRGGGLVFLVCAPPPVGSAVRHARCRPLVRVGGGGLAFSLLVRCLALIGCANPHRKAA